MQILLSGEDMVRVSVEERNDEWYIWLTFGPLEMLHRAVVRVKYLPIMILAPAYFAGIDLVRLSVRQRVFVVLMHLLGLIGLTYAFLLFKYRKVKIRFGKGEIPAYPFDFVLDEDTQYYDTDGQPMVPGPLSQIYLEIDPNLPVRIENFIRFRVLHYIKERFGLYLLKSISSGEEWTLRLKRMELPQDFDEYFAEHKERILYDRWNRSRDYEHYGFALLPSVKEVIFYHLIAFILAYFLIDLSISDMLIVFLSLLFFYILFALVDLVFYKWATRHYFSGKGIVFMD